MHIRALLVACVAALSACAAPQQQEQTLSIADLLSGGRADAQALPGLIAEAERHPLGSRENPVRVNMPAGERDYLARLRCPDNAAPTFQRVGNGGSGVFGSIVDIYTVKCPSDPDAREIWLDMYHPEHREKNAPPGFTLVAESASST